MLIIKYIKHALYTYNIKGGRELIILKYFFNKIWKGNYYEVNKRAAASDVTSPSTIINTYTYADSIFHWHFSSYICMHSIIFSATAKYTSTRVNNQYTYQCPFEDCNNLSNFVEKVNSETLRVVSSCAVSPCSCVALPVKVLNIHGRMYGCIVKMCEFFRFMRSAK